MSKLNLTKEEAAKEIKAVKQTNKVARERRASLRGFASSVLYLVALQAIVDGKVEDTNSGKATGKKKKASKAGVETKILVMDVVDISSSMGSGPSSKMASANLGVNQGLESLKKEESELGVTYNHILVTFDTSIKVGEMQSVQLVPRVHLQSRGATSLNDAIIVSIQAAQRNKATGEKALINIYTDGEENSSSHTYAQAKKAIAEAEKDDIVVTFVGTKYDTDTAISNYGIHASNTTVYDGTARGMSMSMQETSSARSNFSKKVVKGEDVKTGFYKKIIK